MEGTTFRNLGVLRLRASRPVEARDALERSLALYAGTLPEGHALVPRARRYLAEAVLALGDADGAAAVAEETLTEFRELGLDRHPSAADALETLGMAHLARSRPEEAADLFAEALAVRATSSVESDPRLEVTRARLLRAYNAVGETVESRGTWRDDVPGAPEPAPGI